MGVLIKVMVLKSPHSRLTLQSLKIKLINSEKAD